jgi:hypothetical protein
MLSVNVSVATLSLENLNTPAPRSKNDHPASNATALAFNSMLLIEKLSFTACFLPPNSTPAWSVPFPTNVDEKPNEPDGETK